MNLSRYVFRVGDEYYNTMTKVRLPISSSEDTLKENMFLQGQEQSALDFRLFDKPSSLQLRVLPTWQCNLRCKHCSVLQNLKKKDPCRINPEHVLDFCLAHMERYGHKKIGLSFIGGECLLESKICLKILHLLQSSTDAEISSTLTTNFAMNLDKDMVDLLMNVSHFMVSLDGDENQHNWQRKPLDGDVNPYRKTFANLKRAIKLGLSPKMKVQAAIQDEVYDEEKKNAQLLLLTRMGLDVVYSSCHPTIQNPIPDERYLNSLKSSRIHSKPCCEYRYMNFFSVNSDNGLYTEYYALSNRLCDLDDFDLCEIERTYRQKIKDNLSILNDSVCMNECPVVAYCWGKCINNELYFEDFRKNPSKYCGRESLHAKIKDMAEKGYI